MSRDRRLSADYQRAVAQMVEREVVYCVSCVVDSIRRASDCWSEMEVDEEEMYALSVQDDWETPGIYDIENNMERQELIDAFEDLDIELDKNDEGDVILTDEELKKFLIAEVSDWHEFCADRNLDPEQREVYEHWIVSRWLANRLEERGEVVNHNFLGLPIWGRCTTGQSISIDSVIEDIYDATYPVADVIPESQG